MAIDTVPILATALTLPLWGKLIDRFNPLLMRAIINGIWSLTPLLLYFAVSVEGCMRRSCCRVLFPAEARSSGGLG